MSNENEPTQVEPENAAAESKAPSKSANPPRAGALAQEAGPPREERRTRALISIGVALTLSGIALSVADESIARWLVVAGIAIAFAALHRYGRLGPQEV